MLNKIELFIYYYIFSVKYKKKHIENNMNDTDYLFLLDTFSFFVAFATNNTYNSIA